MPKPIVECIPNFSEARRPEVIDRIVAAIQSVPGVHLLDRHSDLDHNRTVITMVGDPSAVEEAAFRSIKMASELIDMESHTGVHPRIGATDVVPFVPISEITMQECVEIAHRLGKRVATELSIPVYLYEEAASSPERQNLENIRKGQYEGLKEEIRINSDRKPDFGPQKLGGAGATVIGARAPLIAFNIYLTSTDIGMAQKIAKAVRHSSGGFKFVKAMGVVVDGRAQVSMNLTNFRQTPLARIVEAVKREAERYGVAIHHSELVGLIPQDALIDAAVWYTHLDDFKAEQLLERRLFEEIQSEAKDQKGSDFLEQLASSDPTPGGGSAAAHTAAVAAALVSMVGRVTIGKKDYENSEPQMIAMTQKADQLRASLISAVDQDAQAYRGLIQATRLPKVTPREQKFRSQALEMATKDASRVPYQVAKMCLEVLELAKLAATIGNKNAIADAVSALHLAKAALVSASMNVAVNVKSLADHGEYQNLLDEMVSLKEQAEQLEVEVGEVLFDRIGTKF
ncbi:MAG: glutamate formimidoyltransferase [Chloroflexi bacterium]|nr:glutamate formimidoyltransferase [Chloroflexota bacterium]